MRIARIVFLAILCTFLSAQANSLFAEERTIPQLQADLSQTPWLVTIDGEERTRTLKISGVFPKTPGVFSLDAQYGKSDAEQTDVKAELSQTNNSSKLMITTQPNSHIIATRMPDGSFAGTVTRKNGETKGVKITQFTGDTSQVFTYTAPGTIVPIKSGDLVTRQFLIANQRGTQQVTFAQGKQKSYSYDPHRRKWGSSISPEKG